MIRTLLSSGVGIPVALVAMSLLFLVEFIRVTGRRQPVLLRSYATVASLVLVALVIARFAKFA